MNAPAGNQADPVGRGLSPSLPIAPALITPDPLELNSPFISLGKSDLATHEASHVVAGFAMGGYLIRVQIEPNGHTQGAVAQDPPEAQAMLYYAGGAGNALFGGGSGGDYSEGDIECAAPYLARAGWSEEQAIDAVTVLLNRPEHLKAIELIRDALLSQGSVDGMQAVVLAREAGMNVMDSQGSYETWIQSNASKQARIFSHASLPQTAEHLNGPTLPQWLHETGVTNPPPMVAENEEENPPQKAEINPPPMVATDAISNPPPMVAEDDGDKPRRVCPLPSIPGVTWKPKSDGSYDCYLAPSGRFTDQPRYLGRVGKRLLANWTTQHGKSKRQLRPIVTAWVAERRAAKGI